MPKVSIIIPVYNTEKYLRECLDSVVSQTLKDIEIICINDGSTDNSLQILKEYAQNDNRIKIIDKENGGISFARNTGLQSATGKYVGFVDSDDWIELNFYEKLYNTAIKYGADIALTEIIRTNNNRHFFNLKKEKFADNTQKKFKLAKIPQYNYVWNKIYNREKLLKINIPFEEGIAFEDINWSPRVLYYMGRLVTVPDTKYFYRYNSVSIVNSMKDTLDDKKRLDFLYASLCAFKFAQDNNIRIKPCMFNGFKCTKYKIFGMTLLKRYNFLHSKLVYISKHLLVYKKLNIDSDIEFIKGKYKEIGAKIPIMHK